MDDIMITLPSTNTFTVYIHINKLNHKRYIGITSRIPTLRWGKDGAGYKLTHQPLFYNAIQKYGWDNFEHIIYAEHLTFIEATTLEKHLIEEFHTCISDPQCQGYNMSWGGDGHTKYDYGYIYQLFEDGYTQTQIHELTGAALNTIHDILISQGISSIELTQRSKRHLKKQVVQLDLNGNPIQIFESVAMAAKQFTNPSAATHIARVCRGERKATCGYKWRYVNE